MALNFSELPTSRPDSSGGFPVIEDSRCIAVVKEATAKISTGAATNGQQMLAVVFDCTSFDSKVKTRIWDNFYESEKPLLRYKLSRFITALGIVLEGEFTFSDLAKIVANKKLILATKLEDNTKGGKKNVVDAFDDEIFYPFSQLKEMLGADDEPFTAEDGEAPFSLSSSTGSDSY